MIYGITGYKCYFSSISHSCTFLYSHLYTESSTALCLYVNSQIPIDSFGHGHRHKRLTYFLLAISEFLTTTMLNLMSSGTSSSCRWVSGPRRVTASLCSPLQRSICLRTITGLLKPWKRRRRNLSKRRRNLS